MNILLEKNIISELKNGTNFGYIFRNKEQFSLTEYKVLKNQEKNVFIKCMKMLYNGKIELFYILDGWKSLESIAANINENSFLTIMTNILASIIDVRNNGFLSCQNIDISFDKIYIDPNTLKVRLVYVPCKERIFEDYLIFENTLRTELIKFIQCHAMEGIKTERFAMELSDGMLSLKDLYNHLKGVKSSVETKTVKLETKSFSTRLRFVAINAPFRCELVVDKSEFVIGKNPALVDGPITFNKAISRIHCKIVKEGEGYRICDLNSANGTYVNGERLEPNEQRIIKKGDIVRLANSDFEIIIEQEG